MKRHFFIFLLAIGVASTVMAEYVNRGGSKVLVNYKYGEMADVSFRDLYDAKFIHGRKLMPIGRGSTTLDLVQAIIPKLAIAISSAFIEVNEPNDIAHELNTFTEAFLRDLDKGSLNRDSQEHTLEYTSETDEYLIPNHPASYLQVVDHTRFGLLSYSIIVDRFYYDKLDSMSKAGVILHEAMFHILARSGIFIDSFYIRRAIGLMFTGDTFSTKDDLVLKFKK
jgi:hypothetical protein